jgi:type I restriction enzyme S subunit
VSHALVPLDDIVRIAGGGTPSTKRPEYFRGHIPWVSPKDMKSWEIVDSVDHVTEEAIANSSTTLIACDAVLVVTRSGVLKHTLPVAINRVPVTLNQDMKALICSDRVIPDYLARALQALSSKLLQTVRGTTADNISTDVLRALEIPLPSLHEQRRIAGQLEQADRLRRTRRYALKLSDTFLPVTFLKLFGDLYENPRKWPFEQLEENADIASGVAKGQKYGDSKTLEVPYLRVANVQDGYLDLSEIKTIRVPPQDVEALRLQPGDVVMTEGGDFDKLGRGAIWPGGIPDCIHQNHIFRVRLNQSALTPKFFAAFLRSSFAKRYFLRCSKQTTNLASINMTQLRATPIPLPPLPFQQKFVALVERVEHLRAVQREALRQADHLFASLLERAFRTENP